MCLTFTRHQGVGVGGSREDGALWVSGCFRTLTGSSRGSIDHSSTVSHQSSNAEEEPGTDPICCPGDLRRRTGVHLLKIIKTQSNIDTDKLVNCWKECKNQQVEAHSCLSLKVPAGFYPSLGLFCVQFACSSHVRVGFLQIF